MIDRFLSDSCRLPNKDVQIKVRLAQTPGDLETVRALFREYQHFLGVDLCFQDFAAELATLPGRYAPPRGRLLLAFDGVDAAGCAALRPLEGQACEMKRLFVRPAWRNQGLGRRLATQIVNEAIALGYALMRLDTLETLETAMRLYSALDFKRCAPYYANPLPGVVYWERALSTPRVSSEESRMLMPCSANHYQVDHMERLRQTFHALTGRCLINPALSPEEAAEALFYAPFAVLSHDAAPDPILTYGNRAALELFAMSWEEFTRMPSRFTAEAPNRAERARLLTEVAARGFIEDYSGVRIANTGQRFRIERATVWNLTDEAGQWCGQAATFREWRRIAEALPMTSGRDA